MQGRPQHSQSPGLPGGRYDAALLNNLNTHQVDKPQNGLFHHTVNYLSKIKNRFLDDQQTYKQFLEILQTYQKEQRHVRDVSGPYILVLPCLGRYGLHLLVLQQSQVYV